MPEWLFAGLVSIGGILLTTAGLVTGYAISARTARLTSTQQAAATAKATEQSGAEHLIDALQEELQRYRNSTDQRALNMELRITGLEERNHHLMQERDGYRNHAHELRAHIWDGKMPPPPEWPTGLPR